MSEAPESYCANRTAQSKSAQILRYLFGVHRSVYYAQVKRPIDVQRIELRSQVRALRGAAGSRAISQMLRQSGVDAGRWLAR